MREDFAWSLHLIEEKIKLKSGLNEIDRNGYTALFYACSQIYEKGLVERIIEAGADVNLSSPVINTYPLIYVSHFNDDVDTVESLLRCGANPNLKTKTGNTALYYAAKYGSERLVQCLLDHQADVNIQGETGCTPLMLATISGELGKVKQLVQAGAQLELKDKEQRTAIVYAYDYGWGSIVDYLLSLNVDINPLMLVDDIKYYLETQSSLAAYVKERIHLLSPESLKKWKCYRLKAIFQR